VRCATTLEMEGPRGECDTHEQWEKLRKEKRSEYGVAMRSGILQMGKQSSLTDGWTPLVLSVCGGTDGAPRSGSCAYRSTTVPRRGEGMIAQSVMSPFALVSDASPAGARRHVAHKPKVITRVLCCCSLLHTSALCWQATFLRSKQAHDAMRSDRFVPRL